ncbi:MAG: ribonuclease P protein component [Smithella sp.]|jgi:ribonuclease P protein component|nr:ribonuclease P protein component [Smithella sp.]
MKEQSYRKLERITNHSRYRTIYQEGVWRSSQHFTAITCSNSHGVRRLGLTVTKKAGNAVRRNRIKRLIKEYFRLNKSLFPAGYDVVIMVRRNMPPLTYPEACKELTELFTQKTNI